MAGGTFTVGVPKIRPGTYVNFESTRRPVTNNPVRGTMTFPLINHTWGPAEEFISITSASPDEHISKLGYSVYDADNPQMLLIREALKEATTVIVCITKEGEKATITNGSLTATAMYGGSRGNDLKFSVAANPMAGFDVTLYFGADTILTYEGVATIEQLAAASDKYIKFSGSGPLTAIAGASLQGGTDGVSTNADIVKYLDLSESVRWQTMAFPVDASESGALAMFTALKSKMEYFREESGKYRKAVVSDFKSDYEGIINVTNSVELSDGTALTHAQATVYAAALDAAALATDSNTYVKYDGAVRVVDPKTHLEAEAAIENGEFFFSYSEDNEVIVEYDINSLTTFTTKRSKDYSKNRVLRTYDTFAERLMLTFPPNKFDNDDRGWDTMEGLGKALLSEFGEAGALKNIDLDNDFKVDRAASDDDETYFDIGLQAVDSSEKLYFRIRTR